MRGSKRTSASRTALSIVLAPAAAPSAVVPKFSTERRTCGYAVRPHDASSGTLLSSHPRSRRIGSRADMGDSSLPVSRSSSDAHAPERGRLTRGSMNGRHAPDGRGHSCSNLAVFLDVPAEDALATLRTLVGLLPVLLAHLRRLEGIAHLYRFRSLVRALQDRRDEHFRQRDAKVFDLRATRLAYRDLDLRQMPAVRAVLQNSGRGLVQERLDRQVVEADLADTAAASRRHAAGLSRTPGIRLDIYPALVVGVLRFAGHAVYAHIHIY